MAPRQQLPVPLSYAEVLRLLDPKMYGHVWRLELDGLNGVINVSSNDGPVRRMTNALVRHFIKLQKEFTLLADTHYHIDSNTALYYKKSLSVYRAERDDRGNYVVYQYHPLINGRLGDYVLDSINVRRELDEEAKVSTHFNVQKLDGRPYALKEEMGRLPPNFTQKHIDQNDYIGFWRHQRVTFVRSPIYHRVLNLARKNAAARRIQSAFRRVKNNPYTGLGRRIVLRRGGFDPDQRDVMTAALRGVAAASRNNSPRRRNNSPRRRNNSPRRRNNSPLPGLRAQTTWRVPIGGSRVLIR